MKVYRSRIDEDGVRHITVNGEPLEMSTILTQQLTPTPVAQVAGSHHHPAQKGVRDTNRSFLS